jgi:hypothetical protein
MMGDLYDLAKIVEWVEKINSAQYPFTPSAVFQNFLVTETQRLFSIMKTLISTHRKEYGLPALSNAKDEDCLAKYFKVSLERRRDAIRANPGGNFGSHLSRLEPGDQGFFVWEQEKRKFYNKITLAVAGAEPTATVNAQIGTDFPVTSRGI